MSLQENKDIVQRFFEEASVKGNLDIVDELGHANFVYHGTGGIELHGLERLKKVLQASFKAFPDIQLTIGHMVAEGDKVATRFELTGTHQGEYLGMAPTGKKVTWWAMQICRIEEGKLVEVWRTEDRTTQIRAASS